MEILISTTLTACSQKRNTGRRKTRDRIRGYLIVGRKISPRRSRGVIG